MQTAAINKPKSPKANAPMVRVRYSAPPLLDNGYRLSRAEFHRRYELLPEVKKAELIEGIVIMGSPVSLQHAQACGLVTRWLGPYADITPGVSVLSNGTVLLDADNEPQPDIMLLLDPECGGQTRASENGYIEGPPELVVEVAYTSVAHDMHEKLKVYRRNRVLEYVVWQLGEKRLDWFVWKNGDYISLQPASGNLLCSRVFPGLWLERSALLAGDMSKVLNQLQKGLRSPEHRQFVKRLGARK